MKLSFLCSPLLLAACSSPALLDGHNPRALLALRPTAPRASAAWKGRRVLLRVTDDLSQAPSGGYFDEDAPGVTPINEIYHLNEAALALMESAADALSAAGAQVRCAYTLAPPGDAPPGAETIELGLQDFELHLWRRSGEARSRLLGRARIKGRRIGERGASPFDIEVQVNVDQRQDALRALAEQLLARLGSGAPASRGGEG